MKILLADDQSNVLYALHVLLASRPELNLAGEAMDAHELFALLKTASPDMLILDWLLPGLSGAGSIDTLRELRPGIIIIALSGRPELGREAISSGADAFVSKIDPPERLLAAIDSFHNQDASAPVASSPA